MIFLSRVFTMNKMKKNCCRPITLTFFGLILCAFGQNGFSQKVEVHGEHHGHQHTSELNGKPIGKPSSSITLDYELPEGVVAGQEFSFTILLKSAIQASGSLSVYYKADDGLDITSKNSLALEFNGEPVSTTVTFNAEYDGLYYLNYGVMQLDENSNRIQTRSFVIPIQVGANEYMGKVSNIQSKASSKLINTEISSGRKLIEMIAE